MCLAVLYAKKSNRRVGYKLLHTKIYGGFETGQCSAGRVTLSSRIYTSDPNHEMLITFPKYPLGFHIFLDRKSAERVQRLTKRSLILCKVRFKDEVAHGEVEWDFYMSDGKVFRTPTVVARQCKIVEVIR